MKADFFASEDLVPVSYAVVLLSYLNVAAIVGRGAGGPIGGLLYDNIGWRWFVLSLPFMIFPDVSPTQREHALTTKQVPHWSGSNRPYLLLWSCDSDSTTSSNDRTG